MSSVVVGNLGKDPDVKYFESGTVKVTFSVADRLPIPRKEGETVWRNVECWGKIAELAANYVRKGSLVALVGEHYTETYEKDGEKKTRSYFLATRLVFLDKRGDNVDTSEDDDSTPLKAEPELVAMPAASNTKSKEKIPF